MNIKELVQGLEKKYKTRDVDELVRALSISLYNRTDFENLLGMYAVIEGRSCIFLNANMEEPERRIVLAHELGHALLHKPAHGLFDLASFTLFSTSSRTEYEANLFACHLLLEEKEIEQLARDGYDIVSIAQILNVDINLLLMKLHEMQKAGYEIPETDPGRADFLRR